MNYKDYIDAAGGFSDYADKRSSKLDQEDFLSILVAFNSAGFHFS